MKFVAYENTTCPTLYWTSPTDHIGRARGYGYQTATHFAHFYGNSDGVWGIGLCVTQGVEGSLHNWQAAIFGATNRVNSVSYVGQSVAGVWRPGIESDEGHPYRPSSDG